MKKINKLISLVLILTIFSCAKKDKDLTVEQAYREAAKTLNDKRYSAAAEKFEKVGNDYPLSKWSSKALVMAAYAYYKEKEYADVIRTVDEFITSNPANEDVAYMQYLKALTHYDLIPDIKRGQEEAQLASYGFRELIARFPNSIYAQDAKEKLVNVDEHLAGARMSVGRYNIQVKNYIGAIQNFTLVIERYKNTNQAPEAYYRLVEVHYKLGMKKEAKNFAGQLKQNYPQSEWTKRLEKIKLEN
jgi:outer membrane protein assembly factor BamD